MKLRRIPVNLLVLLTTVLAGCGTTERDWKQAKDANTASGYAGVVAKHPQGAHVDEARAAIEEIDWTSAKAKDTTADYNKYLGTYSAGRHAVEAKTAIEAIETVAHPPVRCWAYYAEITYTFDGFPSGQLVSFHCGPRDGKGKPVRIELATTSLENGKVVTKKFGAIQMKMVGSGVGGISYFTGGMTLKSVQAGGTKMDNVDYSLTLSQIQGIETELASVNKSQ
jgi:hypothetical protein